ncbi:hypothetical protein L7750_10530 [Xenorhabdus bovienii]|uniref:hypothetical protein n=1 Tax=Xenorhabdus bovienii TaxID=40576 RepID=UPI001EE12123|nr:hypothetical protein [Xenorhabdus bovienii]MCG3470810.1 hypothetical protein [Xenorhabdus bovienii]
MKLLKFNDEMLQLVINGRKTQTRRPIIDGTYSCDSDRGYNTPYGKINDTISFANDKGEIKGELIITNNRVENLHRISKSDVKNEGFESWTNFAFAWSSIYHNRGYGWDIDPLVWVIEFRRINND